MSFRVKQNMFMSEYDDKHNYGIEDRKENIQAPEKTLRNV